MNVYPVFGIGPWHVSPVHNFQPCYECGRETKEGWGYCVRDAKDDVVLDDLSQEMADAIAGMLNAAYGKDA